MDPKVVDISGKPRRNTLPVPDFWFAQVDHRLGRIETIMQRLAQLIGMLVCTSAAVLILEILNMFSKGAP